MKLLCQEYSSIKKYPMIVVNINISVYDSFDLIIPCFFLLLFVTNFKLGL